MAGVATVAAAVMRGDNPLRDLATEGLALFAVAAAHGRGSPSPEAQRGAMGSATAEEISELLLRNIAEKQSRVGFR